MAGNINIAIDGFSSCGKSTIAKGLAAELEYIYVDSGAMYRAITLYAMRKGLVRDGELDVAGLIAELPNISVGFKRMEGQSAANTLLNGEDVEVEIRTLDVSGNVSVVSAVKEVRHKLVELQQELASHKGVVMDGRDIGTTVLPNAEVKVFVTADVDVRAERRHKELREKGFDVTIEDVKHNLQERDHIDQSREESPLRMADGAFVLDNTHLNLDQQLEVILNLCRQEMAH